jgi:hypothetical protein
MLGWKPPLWWMIFALIVILPSVPFGFLYKFTHWKWAGRVQEWYLRKVEWLLF